MLFAFHSVRRELPVQSHHTYPNESQTPPSPRRSPLRRFFARLRSRLHVAQVHPSLQAASTHRATHRRRRHPEALPGQYTSPFRGPVMGVVVIGCQRNRTAEEEEAERALLSELDEMLELVPPRRADAPVSPNTPQHPDWASLNELLSREFSTCGGSPRHVDDRSGAESEDDEAHAHSVPVGPHDIERPSTKNTESVFDSFGSGSVPRRGGRAERSTPSRSDEPTTTSSSALKRNVLNRGYIIFTDDFAAAHPDLATSLTVAEFGRSYRDKHTSCHIDPSRSAHRQRQMEIDHYLALAEEDYCPLFRRRASSLVYGRAAYLTAASPEFASACVQSSRA